MNDCITYALPSERHTDEEQDEPKEQTFCTLSTAGQRNVVRDTDYSPACAGTDNGQGEVQRREFT